MMINNKGFTTKVLLIALLLVSIFFGVYAIYHKRDRTLYPITPEKIEDWKTYTDFKNKFSFRYSSNLVMNENKASEAQFKSYDVSFIDPKLDEKSQNKISSPNITFSFIPEKFQKFDDKLNFEELEINGKKAFKTSFSSIEMPNIKSLYYYIELSNNSYVVFRLSPDSIETKDLKVELMKMINSFK